MRKALIVAILAFISITNTTILGQQDFEKELIDSVIIDSKYAMAKYEITGTAGATRGNIAEQLVIYLNGQPMIFTGSKSIKLHNFNKNDKNANPNYARDINGDGFKEIIILGHTGLGSCCNHLAFHTLSDSVVIDLGIFELKDLGEYQLKDLDKDSIPELIFSDPHFVKWNTSFSSSPHPTIIWKWHENKYKAANYKFSKYLAEQITKENYKNLEKAIKRRVEKEYDPQHEFYKYPPSELWGLMLDYIYCNQSDKAKSIFDQYWPKEIPGKDEFYEEFQAKYKSSDYWKDINRSDW